MDGHRVGVRDRKTRGKDGGREAHRKRPRKDGKEKKPRKDGNEDIIQQDSQKREGALD